MKNTFLTLLAVMSLSACTLNIVKDSSNVRIPTTNEGSVKLSIADSNFGGEAESTTDEVVDEVIPE